VFNAQPDEPVTFTINNPVPVISGINPNWRSRGAHVDGHGSACLGFRGALNVPTARRLSAVLLDHRADSGE
jgi:hypothetical protein